MYCTNCGNKIEEGADVCIHCGKLLKKEVVAIQKKHSGFSVAALVLGIIGVFIGFCCLIEIETAISEIEMEDFASKIGYIIGYTMIPMILAVLSFIFSLVDLKNKKNGFNIAGLVLSSTAFLMEALQALILIGGE